ncbi:hypothetical protein OK016_18945 [Vibrio chagasii]|nr:hypothetical protein [Vibrio chagasii]
MLRNVFYEGAFRTASRGRGPTMVPHKRFGVPVLSKQLCPCWLSYVSASSGVFATKSLSKTSLTLKSFGIATKWNLKKCDLALLASPASASCWSV